VEDIVLRAPPARAITGVVLDADGEPAIDALVQVNGSEFSMGDTAQNGVLTDTAGAFSIGGLLPGSYEVSVNSARGEALAPAVLAGSSGVRLQLTGYGSLSGEVRDTAGAPVVAFTVHYADARGQTRSVSGSAGRWSLQRLVAGQYRLIARSDAGSAPAQRASTAERRPRSRWSSERKTRRTRAPG